MFGFRSSSPRRPLKSPAPAAVIEAVEPRLMLSGDVTATLVNGHLKIVGDAEGNDLVVTIAADGSVSFTSNSTTVNGGAAADVALTGTVESIAVGMKDGQDTVVIEGAASSADTPSVLPSISGDITVRMGADTDALTLRGLNVGGRVYIAGDDGNDRVTVEALEVGGEFIAAGNLADDTVSVRRLTGQADVHIRGGGDVDTLTAGQGIAPGSGGSLTILSGGGDDVEREYPEDPEDPSSETDAERTARQNAQALANQEFTFNPHGEVDSTTQRDWEYQGNAFVDGFPAFDPDEFQTTSSGLQFRIIDAGTGSLPAATDTVTTHYQGLLASDASQFDSSYDRGNPSSFPLSGVIDGWTEGLQLIAAGGKIQLLIPPDLAYGSTGQGSDIPPDATLFFNIELVSIG